MTHNSNSIRIIGGQWRARRLSFPALPELRPTPDRVRETVFNWLQHDIVDAVCLDLFAGSGAFGFEALSRGARAVVMIDYHPSVIHALRQNAARLSAAHATIIQADLRAQLPTHHEPFTIIFCDPPYHAGLLAHSIEQALPQLTEHGYLYLETAHSQPLPTLPPSLSVIKAKTAAHVAYYLLQKTPLCL